jgi:signal transduction histidine kinase
MIVALAPPMAVLSLGTTRLMMTTLQRQADATLDYAAEQNVVSINRDLTSLRTLVEQRTEQLQRAVSAAVADGAVGDLITRGDNAAAGEHLVSALEPAHASMITVLDARGVTVARATSPAAFGDDLLVRERNHAVAYVTDLRAAVRAATRRGRTTSGIIVLSPAALEAERVTRGAAIAGLTKPGDRLSDQAWILLATGRETEERGLALAALLPLRDSAGVVRGVVVAARLVNRDAELAETYHRLTGRWMAMCLDRTAVVGDLPTDHRSVVGQLLAPGFLSPVLSQGKRRWIARLDSTGVDLNAAARPLRDIAGVVVGAQVAASPLTETQMVVDRIRADAARLEMRSLIWLLAWLAVGSGVALLFAGLAARLILTPIRELQVGARRIGEGDFSYRLRVGGRPPGGSDELAQLAAEFNRMAERLQRARDQERLALIGRMASGIAHDIRNALTSIRGYAPLLAEEDLPPEQRREFADILVQSTQRIGDMARDLLEFGQPQSGSGELTPLELRVMSVDQYLEQIRPQLQRELSASNITLELDLNCPAPVRIDPARMSRVIFNLVSNALDAMGDRDPPQAAHRLTIASRCQPAALGQGQGKLTAFSDGQRQGNLIAGYAEIRFSDTGRGIPPEMEGRLFQPFASFGKDHGTGLGLAVCKQIVEAHRGTIEVVRRETEVRAPASEVRPSSLEGRRAGVGATFVIRLPLAAADQQDQAPSS